MIGSNRHLRMLGAAASIALAHAAVRALPPGQKPPSPPQVGTRMPDMNPLSTVFDSMTTSVTVNAPTSQTLGMFGWFTSARDLGNWFCGECSTNPGTAVQPNLDSEWASFITTVVNPTLGAGPMGAWRLGDTIALCNGGGLCVVLTFTGYQTSPWRPDYTNPKKKNTKPDNGKYKNSVGMSLVVPPNITATPFFDASGNIALWLLSTGTYAGSGYTITVGPIEPVPPQPTPQVPPPGTGGTTDPGGAGINGTGVFPGFDFAGGTGWAGGTGNGSSCVHVDSMLPDGRRAGDVKVGDIMALGDEFAEGLTSLLGEVTFSKRKSMPGWRITASDGISLVCSETAPIWTDEGYVLAPNLLGKRIATRLDDDNGSRTAFKVVERVEALGMIDVQHITVGNRAFWAGETPGAFILHHNLKTDTTP